MPPITDEKIKKILSPIPSLYENDEQEKKCELLVNKLSDEEKEEAACTSYAYYHASLLPDKPSKTTTILVAKRFARRHLVAEKDSARKAFEKMKKTLKWRRELQINDLRRCYASNTDLSAKDKMKKFREQVDTESKMQESYISGFDKKKCAILMRMHRTSPDSASDDYLIHNVYLLERAIACTEFASDGKEEKIFSICDFAQYARANIPSASQTKPTIQALQDHYPERLKCHVIIWVDGGGFARALVKAVWSVVKMFLNADTSSKVQFFFNPNKRDQFVSAHVDDDQAMPFMIPTGKQKKVKMDFFLNEVQFTCSANEVIQ